MKERQRLLIIGLDGATWDIINPLMEQGRLPTIQRLVARGASRILRSTIPPISAPAWASMFTGVNPGKHGIFGFNRLIPGTYDFESMNGRSRGAPALWHMIGHQDQRSILVNIPVTYPPDEVNGVMIAGMGTPGVTADFVYPPAEKARLLSFCPTYQIDPSVFTAGDKLVSACVQNTEQRMQVTRWLMGHHDWDLCIVVFVGPDRVQHDLLDTGDIHEGIVAVHAAVDQAIADLLRAVDAACSVMLVSDHGFGPAKVEMRVRQWLQEKGIGHPRCFLTDLLGPQPLAAQPGLTFEASPTSLAQVDADDPDRGVKLATTAPDSTATLILPPLATEPHCMLDIRLTIEATQPGQVLEGLDRAVDSKPIIYTQRLHQGRQEIICRYRPKQDRIQLSFGLTTFGNNPVGEIRIVEAHIIPTQRMTGTLVFSGKDAGHLHINLRGREPLGVVMPGREEANLKRWLIRELLTWQENGQRVVSYAHAREEIYAGPYLHLAPDVVYWSEVGMPPTERHATHRRDGIFVLWGPHVSPGKLHPADIYDVTPTALYLMGHPIPDDLDGHIMADALATSYLTTHPPRFTKFAARPMPEGDQTAYTPEEHSALEEHLRQLGYVE